MYIEDLKFSLWADFIERDFLDTKFKELIDKKIVNGATSNPAIFKDAILNSPAYKEQIKGLKDKTPKERYEAVAIYDIQKACDVLKPLYDSGDDGFVSIEVDPYLCDDKNATIEEGKRLYKQINRDNVMIKIPATDAGYEAMSELVKSGINVNATLVFTKEQAISCAKAFSDNPLHAKNVISVFVSRIDRALDKELQEKGIPTGLSGIYNSADIYNEVQKMGIENCRVLFASTGVKDDSLPQHYYVEKLLGFETVNTAPIKTIEAFCQDGKKDKALPIDKEIIKSHFDKIKSVGIDFDGVLQKLIDDGLEAFKIAFKEILESI